MKTAVDKSAIVNIPASSTGTLILAFQVPHGARFRLTGFCNFIRDLSARGYISWQLRRNGIGLYPYHNVTTLNGEEGIPVAVDSSDLEFYGGDLVEWYGLNSNAGIDFEAGAQLKGDLR